MHKKGWWVVLGEFNANMQSRDDGFQEAYAEYLKRAKAAVDGGDSMLGMHLYLTAFEEAAADGGVPSDDAVVGLKKAWALACNFKERSLAEYIFEKLEPYLDSDEVALCADQLQSLALAKLEEFGVSRDDLEDMADMITQDFLGLDSHIVKVEHIIERPLTRREQAAADGRLVGAAVDVAALPEGDADASAGCSAEGGSADAPRSVDVEGSGAAPIDGADGVCADAGGSTSSSSQDGQDAPSGQADAVASDQASAEAPADTTASPAEGAANVEGASAQPAQGAGNAPHIDPETANALARAAQGAIDYLKAADEAGIAFAGEEAPLDYRSLAGYDSVIQSMRDIGIGMQDDERFQELVRLLNTRHGLDRMPALDTLLFRSPAREDANRFVAATLGELKKPVLRMHMEENLQGMPLLCVTAQADSEIKLSSLKNVFDQGGVLVLEDIDLWGVPTTDLGEEPMSFIMMQLSRGAREAVNLIRSAVDNPDVYVLATASSTVEVDGFFLDMLEPVSVVDIDYPTPEERLDIWMDIAREHPSIRSVNRADLVRLSANMPRYDIYMAAREAVEEAYKIGLVTRHYRPVTRDNLFDKLAAYQPLDSREYHDLEEAVVRDFRADLDHIDDILKGE